MYSYVTAVLRKRKMGSPYKTVDVRNMLLSDIVDNYFDGWIELSNNLVTEHFFVDLPSLRRMALPYGQNVFQYWLGQVANIALPSYNGTPSIKTSQIIYSNGWQAGFSAQRCLPGNAQVITDGSYPNSSLRDVLVTKSGYNGMQLSGKLLATVNGLLHCTSFNNAGMVILEAGRTLDTGNNNSFGLLDFENIGNVTTVSLTPQMILGTGLSSKITIQLNQNLTNKTAMISMGGFLHAMDGSYTILDEVKGVIQIDTPQIDIPRRIQMTMPLIDLSPLGLAVLPTSNNAVSISAVMSDAVLRKYMCLSQSFIIIVDAPTMYVNKNIVGRTLIPGHYEYHQPSTLPLLDDYGRMLEYWSGGGGDNGAGRPAPYVMRINPREYSRVPLYETSDLEDIDWLYDVTAADGYDRPLCRLMDLGSQTIVIAP